MKRLKSLLKSKPKESDEELVECKICGHKARSITATHIVFLHKISVAEYRRRYPNSPTMSSKTRAIMAEKKKKYWANNPDARVEFGEKIRKSWTKPGRVDKLRATLDSIPEEVKAQRREAKSKQMKDRYQSILHPRGSRL